MTATNYPTAATAVCGNAPSLYLSACKRDPTCAPTGTPATSTTTATSTSTTTTSSGCSPTPSNGGLVYGDFECGGLGVWTPRILDSGLTIAVATPGLTGKLSVQGQFPGASSCGHNCDSGIINTGPLPVTPGVSYKVTFAAWMDGSSNGFVGLMINNGGQRTVAPGEIPFSQWGLIQHPWVAPAGITTADVALDWFGPAARLDTITFAPLSAYCGANPPLGILPDGEFECGLGAWTQEVPDSLCTAGVSSTVGLIPATQGIKAFGAYTWLASTGGPNRSQQQNGVSARLTSAVMPVTPGKKYMLAFTAYFNNFGIGFIGVKINGAVVMTRDPGDSHQGTGYFASNQWFWVAPAGVTTATVTFEAAFSSAGVMGVDSVIFVEVAQD